MARGYVRPEVVVETSWVAEHLKDPNIRIVEVSVDPTAFEQGHIPGAVAFHWFKDLEDPLRRDIIGKERLEALLGRSGIANDTTVILYGDNHNWFAAYAYWLLKYYGHPDARLMNGGRRKWMEEGRPMTKEAAQVTPTTYKAREPDPSIRAFRDLVLESLGRGDRALVDVRSPQEFTGEIIAPPGMTETAQRGGHIPGAVNIPWGETVRPDGTFKSVEELLALYQGRGITPDKEIIAYCRIGERSSHTWFVLRELLGYPKVRNYDGSWTEWGSLINVPIEKP